MELDWSKFFNRFEIKIGRLRTALCLFIYFLNYRCEIKKKKLIIALALLKLDWVSVEFVIGI